MRILAISGSLRAASSNTAVLRAAASLAPTSMIVVLYDGLGDLPHFNPDFDEDDELPQSVRALRRAVGECDGLLISSPEYAHGIAGAMKNALDWLVRSLEFPGKPVALVNASPRAHHAEAQMREILGTMSARLIEPACVAVPLLGRGLDATNIVADPALAGSLRQSLLAFAHAIEEFRGQVPG